MDEDREKGRIASLKMRRDRAAEFARSMIPVFEAARADLTGGLRSTVSLRSYADWLNQRNHKTAKGKVWRAETVSRLLDTHKSLRQQANEEHGRAAAVLTFKHKLLTRGDRAKVECEYKRALTDLASERSRQIEDADALGRALIGQ